MDKEGRIRENKSSNGNGLGSLPDFGAGSHWAESEVKERRERKTNWTSMFQDLKPMEFNSLMKVWDKIEFKSDEWMEKEDPALFSIPKFRGFFFSIFDFLFLKNEKRWEISKIASQFFPRSGPMDVNETVSCISPNFFGLRT